MKKNKKTPAGVGCRQRRGARPGEVAAAAGDEPGEPSPQLLRHAATDGAAEALARHALRALPALVHRRLRAGMQVAQVDGARRRGAPSRERTGCDVGVSGRG